MRPGPVRLDAAQPGGARPVGARRPSPSQRGRVGCRVLIEGNRRNFHRWITRVRAGYISLDMQFGTLPLCLCVCV